MAILAASSSREKRNSAGGYREGETWSTQKQLRGDCLRSTTCRPTGIAKTLGLLNHRVALVEVDRSVINGIYRVSGTASPDRGLEFILTRGDEQSWTLTGTLADPHVAPGSLSEAKRAEPDAKTVKP
jgi:hypothetical protein